MLILAGEMSPAWYGSAGAGGWEQRNVKGEKKLKQVAQMITQNVWQVIQPIGGMIAKGPSLEAGKNFLPREDAFYP